MTSVHSWRGALLSLCASAACGGGDAAQAPPSSDDASVTDASPALDGAADATGDASVDSGSTEAGAEASVPTELVHFLGRFDTRDPAGPRFAWPGSAIAAHFSGTSITAKLHDAGTNYFTVVVDGGAPTVVATSSATDTYLLASGLAAGEHTLLLTKRTESYVGVVQYLGLTPAGGSLVPSPAPFTRRIEYVGDSISCGYGVLGAGPGCPFSDATEDETVAYDALTAAQLDAQQTVVAYSGIGMYRDYGGTTTDQMPTRFDLALADDPTSTWGFTTPPPDVVVVHLGTNDFAKGDPGVVFQQTYVAFLKKLRTHYANAYVLCALSPMLGDPSRSQARAYIQGAISQLVAGGDAKVSYVEFDPQQAADGYGCDYHPSPKTHQNMAARLVPAIKALTGW